MNCNVNIFKFSYGLRMTPVKDLVDFLWHSNPKVKNPDNESLRMNIQLWSACQKTMSNIAYRKVVAVTQEAVAHLSPQHLLKTTNTFPSPPFPIHICVICFHPSLPSAHISNHFSLLKYTFVDINI